MAVVMGKVRRRWPGRAHLLALCSSAMALAGACTCQESSQMISDDSAMQAAWASKHEVEPAERKKATFGAGCFWGVEARFRQIEGVLETAVGYSGGSLVNPTYQAVCTDKTGHAEVVQIEYDPSVVSYEKLLDVFWNGHNPTTRNRQGPDVGSQYRSAIFYHGDEQKAAAEASRKRLDKSGKFNRPIVTRIEPVYPFYRAEEYHQRYLEKRGRTTCASSIK